jgi:small ligand-binding sensory domain FIST
MDAVVAQSCRPVGEPMIVSRLRGNVILELDKKRPVDVLRALFDGAEEDERELLRTQLFVGIEPRREVVRYRHGDLLVRSIVGIDPKTGALAVAAPLKEWDVIQLVVRDPRTAHRELERELGRYVGSLGGARPEGALLFSCAGRGAAGPFGGADHDTKVLRALVGDVPTGGFFSNGEIGTVARRAYLHGNTSAFALFRGA